MPYIIRSELIWPGKRNPNMLYLYLPFRFYFTDGGEEEEWIRNRRSKAKRFATEAEAIQMRAAIYAFEARTHDLSDGPLLKYEVV